MLLCFISGILTGFTFVFKEISFISLITLIPFITSVEKGKKSFLKGAVFASSLNIVTMSFLFNMHPMEFMGLTGFKSLGTVFLMYFGIVLFEGLLGGLFTYIFFAINTSIQCLCGTPLLLQSKIHSSFL